MALLICFKDNDSEFSWRDRALYLDQSFYEQIFFRKTDIGSVLRKISLLGYDGELEIEGDGLVTVRKELKGFAVENSHPQIAEFLRLVDECIASNGSLMVSGDMYPVLKRSMKWRYVWLPKARKWIGRG